MTRQIAVIAGAGPAGLTAAYELLKRTDVVPIVLEATDAIGGIAQTYNYKGNRIDIGGHRFFSQSARVMEWWFNILPLQGAPAADTVERGHEIEYATTVAIERLQPKATGVGGATTAHTTRAAPDPECEDEVMLQRPRVSRIFHRRRFFPYPLAITLSVAIRLGLWHTVLITASYLKARLFPQRDETFLDAFFINRFGRRLYETFFKAYTEKVWGVPCDQIRADWGAQRIKGLSLTRAISHAVRDLLSSEFRKRQAERETSLITRFYYPKYGPGQMWETVAAHVTACGGEIRRRHRVVGLHLRGDRVAAVSVRNEDTGDVARLDCDFFFSTMPIRDLVQMADPAPPPNVRAVARGLQYRDFTTVGLLLRRLRVQEQGRAPATSLSDNWIYVQEADVKVGRVQIFNNWSPYLVADRANTWWIGLEYFVDEGDALWTMEDAALIQLGVREMEHIGFLDASDVLDGCVLRMPKAYPAYFGTYNRLAEIREYVDRIPNLYLIGRNGMHRYNNQDHSMLTAMLAVDNIVQGRLSKANLWDVNLEMVYHEETRAGSAAETGPDRARRSTVPRPTMLTPPKSTTAIRANSRSRRRRSLHPTAAPPPPPPPQAPPPAAGRRK
ncbi:MAG TPA: NAD(P)/FAD-dependent oxidoreductase [Gemmatimonadaceae bacterium]|nr:NAD(P)/FAD-dependent oxidoreductase [Gemmatimonadaceae bacterium]